jgi:DNA (cytosine-5)-methyltransferase 1
VARLQGWQDDWGWRFSGRKTARYRQIGNAFPPPVAQALGAAIRSALEHAGAPEADAAGDADSPDGAHVHDPVFRVLRSRADFLTARQIAQLATGLPAGRLQGLPRPARARPPRALRGPPDHDQLAKGPPAGRAGYST